MDALSHVLDLVFVSANYAIIRCIIFQLKLKEDITYLFLLIGQNQERKAQLAPHLRRALNKETLYKEKLQTGVNSWLGEQEIASNNINFVIVVCVCWCILCSSSAYDVHLGEVSNISHQVIQKDNLAHVFIWPHFVFFRCKMFFKQDFYPLCEGFSF